MTLSNSLSFVITGASGGAWEALARSLQSGAPSGTTLQPASAVAVGASSRVVWLVESPRTVLALALAADPTVKAVTVLDAWCVSAQQALRTLQRQPQHCLLLDAREAVSHPEALARVCTRHFGVAWQAPSAQPDVATPDALRRAIAEVALLGHRRARALFEELTASCTPLIDMLDATEDGPDLASATAHLTHLEGIEREAAALSGQVADLTQSLQEVERARDLLQAQIRELQESSAAEESSKAALAEVEATLAEVEATLAIERQRLAAAEALAGQRSEELTAARARTAALEQSLAEARRRSPPVSNPPTAVAKVTAPVAAAGVQVDKSDALLQAEKREAALILVQLHQVQEELERYYLENEKLRATRSAGAAFDLQIDQASIGAVRDKAPFRELNFLLQGVRIGNRVLSELHARLVDHHGHAGLVLFVTPDGAPLSAWSASGEEGGREFMLLVPFGWKCRPLFDALSRTDWQLVQALAARVATLVQERGDKLAPRWRATALRLQRQLAGLPARWRFDGMRLSPGPEEGDSTVQFEAVDVAGQTFDKVTLRWAAGSAGRPKGLEWELDESGIPALGGWPLTEDGAPVLCWRMGLNLSAMVGSGRGQWQALGPIDRTIVLAMLERLPIALRGVSSNGPVNGEAARLAGLTTRLAPVARQAMRLPSWKRVARSMLGRPTV